MAETSHAFNLEINEHPTEEKLEELKKQISLERLYILNSVKKILSKRGPVSTSLAEDITQQILEKAIKRAATYDSSRAKLQTWLGAMIKTGIIDNYRRQGRTEINTDADTEAEIVLEKTPSTEPSRDPLLQKRLQSALETLKPIDRNIFLRFQEGTSYEELGREFNIKSMNTVGTKINKIKTKLEKILKDKGVNLEDS
ncbi:MAG: hypothetical protein A2754_00260 [Candidatus Magasanikbacteria bacterium RIFCSPHIGHO2_01_FULL_47_8]|uniref:RNA polymerase sigma-70 region 2 domain-containing protein n=1 Tax=Candidatus Magasanikbacteria bacterium RIFCSPHIGHO2_01_FULL_47_8 TaxID=1798673 RepID=A0A1F6MFE9_9BACT|nr:MAG: hypothetical protein A2754_00260 [Candidatus Magasanikbacteria bacterium RIFCSPHIGHO2_01_FULL_47_8]